MVVIIENTVMGQRKLLALNAAAKRVIVFILFGSALRCHPCVTHDDLCIARYVQPHPMCRKRPLVNL